MNGNVTYVEGKLSNSTTTGIVSMLTMGQWGLYNTDNGQLASELNYSVGSALEFPFEFGRGISRLLASAFATSTVPRPALSVQSRQLKVVTKVPKFAIWILILMNLMFALLGIALGISAWFLTRTMDIHQVHTRLNFTGLTAQLFEKDKSEKQVRRDRDLFGHNREASVDAGKRVAIEPTLGKGVTFAVR